MKAPSAPAPASPRRPLPPPPGEPAHPPPFALPGEHFAAALVWLLLGAVGLVLVAPSLAAGNFLDPHVLAVTHAFTLGVVTTAIFGALYQLFPVLLGVGVRSVRVGHLSFWLLCAGVGSLVAGFWLWERWLQAAGWLLMFATVGGIASNLLPQRRKARRGRVIGLYISGGHQAFGLAMFLGGARIGETLGWWTVSRLGIIAAHFHLAALGFATLTAVGVASRMLPMFLASSGYAEWPLRWIGPLAAAGLLAFSAGEIWSLRPLALLGAPLLALAGALFVYLVAGYFRHRATPRLDPAMGHVAVAFGFLALAIVAGLVLLVRPGGFDPRGWAAYGLLAIVGFLTLFIVGVFYRILVFLTWLNIVGPRSGDGPVRPVTELSRPAWAWTSLVLLSLGLLVLVGGVLAGSAGVARVGAGGFLGGVAVLAAHHVRMLLLR